eukprot:GHVS01014131.1.p1 GENE.GHVS01014131.1~~GHVS01014131.1.p1  ORF type:complete len:280 (-),score=36.15 GHVS01014131.1:787-1626(-)
MRRIIFLLLSVLFVEGIIGEEMWGQREAKQFQKGLLNLMRDFEKQLDGLAAALHGQHAESIDTHLQAVAETAAKELNICSGSTLQWEWDTLRDDILDNAAVDDVLYRGLDLGILRIDERLCLMDLLAERIILRAVFEVEGGVYELSVVADQYKSNVTWLKQYVLPLFPKYSHWTDVLREMETFSEESNISNTGALRAFANRLGENRRKLKTQSEKLFEYLMPRKIAFEAAETICTDEDEALRTALCCAPNLYKEAIAKFGLKSVNIHQFARTFTPSGTT